MKYFLDTEFNEFGGALISLALVSEGGSRELYLATECENPGEWVKANVMPIIAVPGAQPLVCKREEFPGMIRMFLFGDDNPVIVSDWPDDIRYFCEALIVGPGMMINIPTVSFKLERVDAYPTTLDGAVQHNALWDARALRHVFTDKEQG